MDIENGDLRLKRTALKSTVGLDLGFLKEELVPYPGRSALVGRMVTAATLSMLITMTFASPMERIVLSIHCRFRAKAPS
ncbi:hypothetical protein [Tunturiibacter gelidiferens]|uniref:Uncharacterized protein n=1 Tax=Tunturiibacter gelidiferens TaxID=3069689 RepID=A0AAU7YVA8_9BACT